MFFFKKKNQITFALIVLATAGAAQAQQDVALEKVIVTAKKRRQDIQTVPQTVDAIGGRTLQNLALQQFSDINILVSGLTLSDNGGQGQNISLRGVTYDPDTAANPAVDLYVNEVPLSQTSTAFQDIYDLDQVEVIRGPQGTLRGRTSPAGAILFDTKVPSLSDRSGYIQQTFSDNGQFQTEGAVGIPIVQDKLAIRMAGLFDQNDLYGTRDVVSGARDSNRQHSLRETVVFHPTEALSITLMHQDSNDRTRQLFAVSGDGLEGRITPAQNLAVEPGDYTFYDRTDLTTLQASYSFGANELNYTGGYQSIKDEFYTYQDKGGLLRGFYTSGQQLNNPLEQLTQELRFQSSGEQKLGYMGGLYYAHQDANATVFTPSEFIFTPSTATTYGAAPQAVVDAETKIPQLVTDYAAFTDESYKLTDADMLEGGLRWQYEKQYRSSGYTAFIPEIFGGGTVSEPLISEANKHQEYRAWTGLASYSHRFSSDLLLYATYGQSYRPGGTVVGETLPLPESFLIYKPETSYDFEIGGKTQIFGGRVRLNADIFHQSYSNYIGREPELWTVYGYATVTTNGNAIARGAEFNANANITDDWHVQLNTTFADSHYDNAQLPCNDFNGSGQPNTDGAPRVIGKGLTSVCTVNASLGQPNWFVSVNTEYDIPLGGGPEAFIRGVYSFQPRNENTLASANTDPRSVMNLYVGTQDHTRGWQAFLFVKNLFNTVGYTNLFGEQFDTGYLIANGGFGYKAYDTGYRSSNIIRQREIGGTLAYRF